MQDDMDRLRKQMKEMSNKNRMQLEQINTLLMEKVTLQSEGIGQRERMLERERDFTCVYLYYVRAVDGLNNSDCRDLRSSISGKDLPEDIKARLLAMHEDNLNLREQVKSTQEKLTKAKQVRCVVSQLNSEFT